MRRVDSFFSCFLQVSRVLTQHIVKLHIVDLIASLRLEALVNKSKVGLACVQLEVVHNLAEASHSNETARAFVLILEEWLDEQAAKADLRAEALQSSVQRVFLFCVENVARVQNGWRHKRREPFSRDLLQVFFGEDLFNLFTEGHVGDEWRVSLIQDAVGLLEELVLFTGEDDLLRVEDGAELSRLNDALAKRVVVLEELEKTDAFSLNNILNLLHQGGKAVPVAGVIDVTGGVGALGASCRPVNLEFKNVAVL